MYICPCHSLTLSHGDLLKRGRESHLSLPAQAPRKGHASTQRERGRLQARKELLPEPTHAGTLSQTSHLHNCKKIYFGCSSHLRHSVMAAPKVRQCLTPFFLEPVPSRAGTTEGAPPPSLGVRLVGISLAAVWSRTHCA